MRLSQPFGKLNLPDQLLHLRGKPEELLLEFQMLSLLLSANDILEHVQLVLEALDIGARDVQAIHHFLALVFTLDHLDFQLVDPIVSILDLLTHLSIKLFEPDLDGSHAPRELFGTGRLLLCLLLHELDLIYLLPGGLHLPPQLPQLVAVLLLSSLLRVDQVTYHVTHLSLECEEINLLFKYVYMTISQPANALTTLEGLIIRVLLVLLPALPVG